MIYVVIGANYGDEGKGNIVSYLAEKHKASAPIVIRHNGGSQAQHRVVYNGDEFIFGHIGSGTFSDAPTFLSKYFITNPLILKKEYDELIKKKSPTIYVDANSRVTTIYDMFYNQHHANMKKHGTCGLGVKATIDRHEVIPLTVGDIINLPQKNLVLIIKDIYKYYHQKMNFEKFDDKIFSEMFNYNYEEHAIDLSKILTAITKCLFDDTQIRKVLDSRKVKIFEGAQGLMLNQNNFSEFPHVTPSNTGIVNAERIILKHIPGSKIEYIFVTRSYLTRHGNGTFNENALPETVYDLSNKNNEFQGALRFGAMNTIEFNQFKIRVIDELDRSISAGNWDIDINVATTHLDQIPNEELKEISKYISMGPSYKDVYARCYTWRKI